MNRQESTPAAAQRSAQSRRTASLHLRCTPSQRDRLQQKATRAGQSVSRYVITAALTKIPAITEDQLLILGGQLTRLGSRLNEAVRWLHTFMDMDDFVLRDALAVWADIRRVVYNTFRWADEPTPPERFVPDKTHRGDRKLRLHIRCTPRQKQRIAARADRRRMTVSVYLLTASLHRTEQLNRVDLTQVYYLLQKIGNNVRQLEQYTQTETDAPVSIYADYLANVKGLFERAVCSADMELEEPEWHM